MDLAPFAGFLLATSVGLGLSVATYAVSRKSGLGAVQASLIDTLQDSNGALTLRLAQLEDELGRERAQRVTLQTEARADHDTIARLERENDGYRRQLGLPPRNGNGK